jgi:hypothetical protein
MCVREKEHQGGVDIISVRTFLVERLAPPRHGICNRLLRCGLRKEFIVMMNGLGL